MKIIFDKKIYPKEAVKNSVCAYEKVGDFRVDEEGEKIRVEIEGVKKEEEELIKDEFCNYVLAETKKIK